MIGPCGPVRGVIRIVAVGWICDEHAHVCHQTNREFSIDMVRGLINKGRQLSLIRRAQKEMSKT